MKFIANLIKFIAKILLSLYFRISVTGRENFPENTNYIIAANHTSYIDPLIVGGFSPGLVRFIMLESFYNHPLINWFCRIFRAIPVSQSGNDISSIRTSLKALRAGDNLGIFPEGGRSMDGSITDPMAGIGLLAFKTEVPVVPVGINGAYKAFPRGSIFPRPFRINVNIGKPILPESSEGSKQGFSVTVMEQIEELSKL